MIEPVAALIVPAPGALALAFVTVAPVSDTAPAVKLSIVPELLTLSSTCSVLEDAPPASSVPELTTLLPVLIVSTPFSASIVPLLLFNDMLLSVPSPI